MTEHEHHHAPISFADELVDFRARKDAFFRSDHRSPIPHERRHDFPGLRYFPPSEAHRIEGLTLRPDLDPNSTTEIVTSDEKTRTAWRVGTFEFAAPEGHGRLAAYTFAPPASLGVEAAAGIDLGAEAEADHDHDEPDAEQHDHEQPDSGQHDHDHDHEHEHEHDDEAPLELFVPFRDATSGVETYGAGRYLDVTQEEDGTFALDFNLAYNPWCAYEPKYSCPLPPRENWLPFRIEAGEQVPDEEAH